MAANWCCIMGAEKYRECCVPFRQQNCDIATILPQPTPHWWVGVKKKTTCMTCHGCSILGMVRSGKESESLETCKWFRDLPFVFALPMDQIDKAGFPESEPRGKCSPFFFHYLFVFLFYCFSFNVACSSFCVLFLFVSFLPFSSPFFSLCGLLSVPRQE